MQTRDLFVSDFCHDLRKFRRLCTCSIENKLPDPRRDPLYLDFCFKRQPSIQSAYPASNFAITSTLRNVNVHTVMSEHEGSLGLGMIGGAAADLRGSRTSESLDNLMFHAQYVQGVPNILLGAVHLSGSFTTGIPLCIEQCPMVPLRDSTSHPWPRQNLVGMK